jgi:hypothetical protein
MQKEVAQAAILHNLKRRGMELKDFGKSIGQSTRTGYNKYNDPKRLTVEDLCLMKATATEIMEIVGVKYET